MGEVLLISFLIIAVAIFGYIFFGGKKKKKKEKLGKKQEEVKEKKVEQAIKSDKAPAKEPEKKETQDQPVVGMPKQEDAQKGFKIIRKKSEVKINKKALKSGSRNPSVSKVFDKNGKKIQQESDQIKIEPETEMRQTLGEFAIKEPGRFGTREIDYDVNNTGKEFSMNNPKGSLNRAPILTDRSHFGSHLHVSEDGNISGVVGTGMKKAVMNIEKQKVSVDDKTEEMVRNVKRNFLGIEEDINPFDFFNRDKPHAKPEKESNLKKVDAKMLILADMINNPKYKKNIKK